MLADHLKTLIESREGLRIEARSARAELGRRMGRIVSEDELERAVGELRQQGYPLSDRKLGHRRHFSKRRSQDEESLYAPVLDYLENVWLPREEHGLQNVRQQHVQIVARARGRDDRPNPDLLGILVTETELDRKVEVFTFEVKPPAANVLETVTQAADQKNFASFAYVAQQIARPDTAEAVEQRMAPACRERGIGLILFDDPPESAKFRVAQLAERNLDPRSTGEFVRNRVDEDVANRLFGVLDGQ